MASELLVVLLLFLSSSSSSSSSGSHDLLAEPANSKVRQVGYDDFSTFIERNSLILMEFYAPWCAHCQELAPEFREAAAIMEGMDLPDRVVFAKYDDSDEYNRKLRAGAPDVFDFQSYPALYVFRYGKHERYLGGREASEIVLYMTSVARGLDPQEEERKAKPGLYKSKVDYDPLVFADLDTTNFEQEVVENERVVWIVEFYSDFCPICKSLTKEFLQASREVGQELPGRVRFGGVNSRVNEEIAQFYGVTSYPWVASFYQGNKIEDMRGLSGADSIKKFALAISERMQPAGVDAPERWQREHKPTVAERGLDSSGAIEEIQFGGDSADSYSKLSWREQLGRHTWYLLHSVGAAYPEHPSPADQEAVRFLVAALGQLFPCKSCRRHLQRTLGSNTTLGPVATGSRQELSQWFCELHNIVNRNNGKAVFSCEQHRLDLMYLQNCAECKDTLETGKTHEALYPWNAQLYAKDPSSYQDIESESEMTEIAELEELLHVGVEYNLLTKKKESRIRHLIETGETTRERVTRDLRKLLLPISKLINENRHLRSRTTCKPAERN
eukprot:759951-Hanusia_phi.AAC.2